MFFDYNDTDFDEEVAYSVLFDLGDVDVLAETEWTNQGKFDTKQSYFVYDGKLNKLCFSRIGSYHTDYENRIDRHDVISIGDFVVAYFSISGNANNLIKMLLNRFNYDDLLPYDISSKIDEIELNELD